MSLVLLSFSRMDYFSHIAALRLRSAFLCSITHPLFITAHTHLLHEVNLSLHFLLPSIVISVGWTTHFLMYSVSILTHTFDVYALVNCNHVSMNFQNICTFSDLHYVWMCTLLWMWCRLFLHCKGPILLSYAALLLKLCMSLLLFCHWQMVYCVVCVSCISKHTVSRSVTTHGKTWENPLYW